LQVGLQVKAKTNLDKAIVEDTNLMFLSTSKPSQTLLLKQIWM